MPHCLPVVKVAMFHNNLSEAEAKVIPEDLPLVKLVAIANDLAKAERIGFGGDQILGDFPDELSLFAGLDNGIDPKMVEQALAEIKDFKEFIGFPDGDAHEKTMALPDLPNNILFVNNAPTIVNLFEIYLENIVITKRKKPIIIFL